ncbi:MAG: PilZ domain-containing protein [Spirochaetia bacterium]|nr:PilZ domain-containing protein [Spirochaetia bacterium]
MDTKGKLYSEKRGKKRVLKEFMVLYKLMPKKITMETVRKNGKTCDVSLSGIKIEGESVGDVGDIIRLEIFGKNKNDLLIVLAEIRWVKKAADKFQFGVKFIGLREEEAETLEEMLTN